MVTPVGHEAIHEGPEALVVKSLEKMDKFVDEYVLEALGWFFNELEIERYAAGTGIAGAPAGSHFLDAEAGSIDP